MYREDLRNLGWRSEAPEAISLFDDKKRPSGYQVHLLYIGEHDISLTEVLMSSDIKNTMHEAWASLSTVVEQKLAIGIMKRATKQKGWKKHEIGAAGIM